LTLATLSLPLLSTTKVRLWVVWKAGSSCLYRDIAFVILWSFWVVAEIVR